MEPILIVMAAGIGSRFGGVKQLASFGKHSDQISDYSLYDAYRAGFRRVVFIVSEAIKADFENGIGRRAAEHMEVHYAVQRMENIPEGCAVPEGRVKPFGTGHAVMCAKPFVDAPFAAINGDDFYGRDAFKVVYDFLKQPHGKGEYVMAGFKLKNTLSENGFVSRGVCSTDENGLLTGIVETTHIISTCDGPLYTLDGEHYTRLEPETVVSMNMWGFTPDLMDELWARFPAFCAGSLKDNPMKAEYYLPFVVNDTLKEGISTVKVLPTTDRWYGITYREDLPAVQEAIEKMSSDGTYPEELWK